MGVALAIASHATFAPPVECSAIVNNAELAGRYPMIFRLQLREASAVEHQLPELQNLDPCMIVVVYDHELILSCAVPIITACLFRQSIMSMNRLAGINCCQRVYTSCLSNMQPATGLLIPANCYLYLNKFPPGGHKGYALLALSSKHCGTWVNPRG